MNFSGTWWLALAIRIVVPSSCRVLNGSPLSVILLQSVFAFRLKAEVARRTTRWWRSPLESLFTFPLLSSYEFVGSRGSARVFKGELMVRPKRSVCVRRRGLGRLGSVVSISFRWASDGTLWAVVDVCSDSRGALDSTAASCSLEAGQQSWLTAFFSPPSLRTPRKTVLSSPTSV